MRLVLDQGLPRGAARLLRERSFDAVHTAEVGLSASSDAGILEWARRRRRMVITLDADFHALMALSGARRPSVVRIRIEGLKAERAAELIGAVLLQCKHALSNGALVTVDRTGVRIRHLPISGARRKP